MKLADYHFEVKDGVAHWSSNGVSGETVLGSDVSYDPSDDAPKTETPSDSAGKKQTTAQKIAAKKKAAAARKAINEGTASSTKEPEEKSEAPEKPAAPAKKKDKEDKEDKEEKPKKSKKTKFTLYINCAPVKGTGKTVCLDEILHELRVELAKELEVESCYEIDAFVRWDALSKVAPEIMERAAGKSLIALGIGTAATDSKAVVDVLRGLADTVIIGVSG